MTRSRIRTVLLASVLASSGAAVIACAGVEPKTRAVFPSANSPERARGTILFAVSAAREQILADGSKRATGTFLGEFYEPYLALKHAGYAVVFATVAGAPATIDPESLDDDYWNDPAERDAARHFIATSPAWRAPLSLDRARAEANRFDGLVVPGGQGLMVDLLEDADLHALLRHFAKLQQPVGLVCHAPALLARLSPPHELEGRAVTSVSGFEEFYIETFVMGENATVRGIGARLEAAGYEHHAAFPGSEHALRDCNLVTSQNPYSTARFGALFLDALRDYRRGARCVAER